MVVRGIYSKAEEEMLAEWHDRLRKLAGWLGETPSVQNPYPVFHRVASRDLILHMAYAADCWNPLWSDEYYARNTRWGGIIAQPMFLNCISHGGTVDYFLKVPPEVGVVKVTVCHSYDFFKPIYIDDSFRVFIGRHKLEDITRSGETSHRKFKHNVEVNYINQRDQLVGIFRRADIAEIFLPGTVVLPPDLKFTQEYVYTPDQIAAIDRLSEEFEVRGSQIRYWEDVNEGDDLKGLVMGPVTPFDSIIGIQSYGIGLFPMSEVRRKTSERVLVDPVTNIPHKSVEFHITEQGARLNRSHCTTLFPATFEYFFCRLVSNWMGDDGFLRKLEWKKLINVPIGDTIFGCGKVMKKYINEDGEHLVDLNLCIESVRGYVGYVALATVSLLSKKDSYK